MFWFECFQPTGDVRPRCINFVGASTEIWNAPLVPFVMDPLLALPVNVIGWFVPVRLIDIEGESGREIRISRRVDLFVFGKDDTRISDRLGEPPDAMVIKGDCVELTLIKAKNRYSCQHEILLAIVFD